MPCLAQCTKYIRKNTLGEQKRPFITFTMMLCNRVHCSDNVDLDLHL